MNVVGFQLVTVDFQGGRYHNIYIYVYIYITANGS